MIHIRAEIASYKKQHSNTLKQHDSQTQIEPYKIIKFDIRSTMGKRYTLQLQRWNGLIRKGKNAISMHDKLFDLVKAKIFDSNGHYLNYKNI